jgi:hypothetical protein
VLQEVDGALRVHGGKVRAWRAKIPEAPTALMRALKCRLARAGSALKTPTFAASKPRLSFYLTIFYF